MNTQAESGEIVENSLSIKASMPELVDMYHAEYFDVEFWGTFTSTSNLEGTFKSSKGSGRWIARPSDMWNWEETELLE